MPLTGGGGLARVPNLRVCEHPLDFGAAHAGGEAPWYPPVAVAIPPVSREGGRAGLLQKGK